MSKEAENYLVGKMYAYLRACKDGEALIRRWRLLVLGPSGDGKTTLINRLLGKDFIKEHIITNALETDCKVEITHCDREWNEYKADHLDLLDMSVTQGIGQSMINRGAENVTAMNTSNVSKEGSSIRVSFDNMDSEEKQEANDRLEVILESIGQQETRPAVQEKLGGSSDSDFLKFILSIWDLGGQIIYYMLHHIFLRWHCVYVLVVNLSRPLHSKVPEHELPPHTRNKEMEYHQSIEFWLNMVFSHMVKAQDQVDLPSIVLVGTHKDMLHEDVKKQTMLAEKYFNEIQSLFLNKAHFQQVHTQFIAVDSKGGDPENYAKLRALIFELVEGHCTQSRSRPIRWLRLEKKLHELKNDGSLTNLDRNLVTYQRLTKYAKKYHIESDEDLRLFLEYHHLTGDITYCYGEGLNDFVIPHPQWLVDVLRTLITLDNFFPKSQKCMQEIKQLQNQGLLKTNSSLLNEVWRDILKDDVLGNAKQYLLNLMDKFELAVKYEQDTYIIPCLLPLSPSEELMLFPDQVKNLPAMYYLFHSSMGSSSDVARGDEVYDHFLPHGLFQKLVAKCSKMGWAWTKDRYQDSISFTTDDVRISMKVRSTWIILNVFAIDPEREINYHKYQSLISTSICELLRLYHPNMWFERGVNPCANIGHQCVQSIGSTSIDNNISGTHAVLCPEHSHFLAIRQFNMWFGSSPCRILSERDQ